MAAAWQQIIETARGFLAPVLHIVIPIAILVVGWLVALIAAWTIRRLLRRTRVDNRLAGWIFGEETGASIDIEKWAAKTVYYVLMVFVAIAFLQSVGLTIVTEPLKEMLVYVFAFAPRVVSAGVLLLAAWALGSALRFLVTRMLRAARVEERLGQSAGLEQPDRLSIPKAIGNTVYWLVFLIFLPAVLDALGLEGLLMPVRDMLGELTGFLPNLFAGALILIVGWFAARIVQRIVTNLLAAAGLDRAGDSAGLGGVLGKAGLSELVGTILYALILILVAIAALDALQFEAISAPASEMLGTILHAIPAIFIAGVIVLIAYLAGRLVSRLVSDLLTRTGFNTLLPRLGIGDEPGEGERTPSELVGYLVMVAFILFAAMEASDAIGFTELSDMVARVTVFAGHVLLGLIILGVGLYLANLAAGVIRARQSPAGGLLHVIVRGGIIVLAAAMALRQMGIANEIINLAFGLLLGAIAVAVALAFGLGARDIAARELQGWLDAIKREKKN